MNKFRLLAIAFSFCSLVACSPSAQSVKTVVAQTLTAISLRSPTATYTYTSIPTLADTPTPKRTPTPTATYTFTPIPPEVLTAQSKQSTLTMVAYDATQAVEVISYKLTGTAEDKAFQATRIAQYKYIDWRELKSYADNHKGEKVKISIRIFNIVSTSELQGYFAGTYEAVYVSMGYPFSELYENDSITVYGTVGGNYCFTNALNANICQPILTDAFYTKP